MRFHQHNYHLWFFLGSPAAEPLWHLNNWESIQSIANDAISKCRGKPSVRSSQYAQDGKEEIRFGRLGLNTESNRKWCHHKDSIDSLSRRFSSAELWVPSWSSCERENTPPDFFIYISNSPRNIDLLHANPSVIFAARTIFQKAEVSPIAGRLFDLLNPALSGYKERTWGIDFGGVGFSSSIQDLAYTGLIKTGRWQAPVTAECLEETWEII